MERARTSTVYAADAILAFREGVTEDEDPDLPFVGAFLVAEFLAQIRSALGGPHG